MSVGPLILAIDTSASLGGVGLSRGDIALAARELGPAGQQAETLLPTIDSMLYDAAFDPADLGLVVAALGPGSFTGLRIGLAAAQGIGFARGIPVVGVPTTTLRMAWARLVSEDHGCGWAALLDARRGEVFLAAGRSPVGDAVDIAVDFGPELVLASAVRARLEPWYATATAARPFVVCGEGVPVAASELVGVGGLEAMAAFRSITPPRPTDAVRLLAALGRRQHDRAGAPAVLEPLYVRPPDARKPTRPPGPPPDPDGA